MIRRFINKNNKLTQFSKFQNNQLRRFFSNKKDNKKFDYKKYFNSLKNDFNNLNPNNKNQIYLLTGGTISIILYYLFYENFIEEIKYNEFFEKLKNHEIENIKINKVLNQKLSIGNNFTSYIIIKENNGDLKKLKIGNPDNFVNQLENYLEDNNLSSINIEFNHKTPFLNNTITVLESLTSALTIGFIIYLIKTTSGSGKSTLMNGMGSMNFGKSNAKKFNKEMNLKIKFKDVAGMDEAKNEIVEFVDFLKNPKKYKKLGAKIPKGALLSGPPGTGKTMLAKACAGEAEVPFYFVSGSEFVEMYVGVGASRVRDLFKQAKEDSPSIIFIDEIDAIGKKRSDRMGGSNSELDSTLNQLLVEMDGFGTDHNVVIFAATNRKELLDDALTRPGRFDRLVDVNLPDLEGRKQIFDVHLASILLSDKWTKEKFSKRFATLTPGFSGADISNICNEAAINAVRENRQSVMPDDFEVAVERVIGGLVKKGMENKEQKKVVSIHECGHAVTSWFLEGGAPLLKLTIVPRSKGALGFAQYLPNENSLETKEELFDRLITILGGRCAEEHFFGKITTGAYDDLQKAQRTAFSMVTKLGMSDKLGYVNYEENQYGQKPYSDKYNEKIDDEVRNLIHEATIKCRELIQKHEKEIIKLSDKLLEKETLSLQDVINEIGPRPYPMKENFKKYLEEIQNEEFIISENN